MPHGDPEAYCSCAVSSGARGVVCLTMTLRRAVTGL